MYNSRYKYNNIELVLLLFKIYTMNAKGNKIKKEIQYFVLIKEYTLLTVFNIRNI